MRGTWLAACAALAVAGCEAKPEALQERLAAGPLGFLHDGSTTREVILLRLGHPWAQYEGDRIFAYRIGYDGESAWVVPRESYCDPPLQVPAWARNQYSLVLVFDGKDVLEKHGLVGMGRPIGSPAPAPPADRAKDGRPEG